VLYELRYEHGNRPDWIQVPLSGLLAMLEKSR
jgi:predicted trehalose synthase